MDLGLKGKAVQSLLIEYTVRMQLSDVFFIVIESPFMFDSSGESVCISPEEDSEEAFQPVRELVGQTVESATADDAGTLYLRFSDSTTIEVPPDEAYEAWNVSGPNGALVVCTPGGKLAVWSATEGD